LKISLMAIVLLGVTLTQPSFARDSHAHRANGTAVTASHKVGARRAARTDIRAVRHFGAGIKGVDASTGEKATAKDATPVDPHQSDAIETPAAVMTPRPGVTPDKGSDANARFKITAPGNSQVRHVPVLRSSNPVARNAIGQPVVQHEDAAASGRTRVGATVSAPLPSPGAPLSRTESLGKPNGSIGGPSVGLQRSGSVANTSIASPGRTDTTGLIRPLRAPAALGGPAKAVVGISGTTLRPKR
jgi:hypothetical protein